MRRSLLLASVAWLAVTAMPIENSFVRAAHAESTGREWVDKREKWQSDVAQLSLRIRDYPLSPRYCKRPHQKDKTFDEVSLDQLAEELALLTGEFDRIQAGTNAATRSTSGGSLTTDRLMTGEYPNYKGRDVTDDMHWKLLRADYIGAAQKLLSDKRAKLAAAPENYCSEPTLKKAEIIGNPPPPPVQPDPVVTPPSYGPVDLPAVPRFCSLDEKDAWLAQVMAARMRALDNQKAAHEWEQALHRALGSGRGDKAKFKRDLAQAKADDKRFDQAYLAAEKLYVNVRDNVQVEKCGGEPKKEIGMLPGSTGASVEVAGAVGELTIPKKPYLSIEGGGNQFLGVVDHERTATVAALLIGLTYDLDFLPELKFGDVRRNVWRAFGELSTRDFDVASQGGSIVTTTEGVGIPGTGDLTAANPAGVFFANPAFNDVTDIAYSHTSDFQGLSLGLEQRSFYDCGAITLGAGLSVTRLETADILSGSVDGFLTDFRYRTDIETRNTALFIRGGVEVPLDGFWDQSLRYAGEFSGFRIAAGLEAGVNFLDAEGLDRLDLTGFVSDTQSMRIAKDDTTFSYKLGAALHYAPPGAKGLDLSLGVQYGESDTHPVATRSGQTDDVTRIEFEREEIFVGTLGTRFTF